MTTDELKELLDGFLNRWQIEDVENMTLQKYVSVGIKIHFVNGLKQKPECLEV